jgi:hypothetical protein
MYRIMSFVAASLMLGCGPDWNDCSTCKPGEDSVESSDGGTLIPVSVNVQVDVDVSNTNEIDVSLPPVVVPPVVLPPTTPPVVPGCQTRHVCAKYRWHCDNGLHKGNCKRNCSWKRRCVREVPQCF